MKNIIVARCLKCGYVGNTDGVYCMRCAITRWDTDNQRHAKERARHAALASLGINPMAYKTTKFKIMCAIVDRLALMPWLPGYTVMLHWARQIVTKQQCKDWLSSRRIA